MQLIDLSLEIAPTSSEPVPVKIDYVNHREGADLLGKSAGLDHSDFPEEMGLTIEYVQLTTHTGTHIDAPIHYGPISDGQPAKAIVDLPLSWFYSDGVIVDCTDNTKGTIITKDEIIDSIETIHYTLKPFDIVLIKTGADKLWGRTDYFTHFRGMSREATKWLVEQGIKVVGIDTFGFDAPFNYMLNQYKETGDQNYLWPAHFYGREKEYCQIERLANLDRIPSNHGFKVCCFPIKVKNCGAGWSRVVAMIGDK